MKLLVCLIVIALISWGVYFLQTKNHKKKQKKANWRVIGITSTVAFILFILLGILLYQAATAPDTQCALTHKTISQPPRNLRTATDYFLQGNYDYDRGNCEKAITDYSKSLMFNPTSPETYNNRAYTYMRMQDYRNALPDLDKAIQLNPGYIQALMNRGDIHNYYYNIDRFVAIKDYKKVIALGGSNSTSVCGHLMLARHNGWNIGTFIDLISGGFATCN